MTQKKKYINLEIEMLDCPLERAVLDASLTDTPIDPDNVGVDPYTPGFSDPGGFDPISFD